MRYIIWQKKRRQRDFVVQPKNQKGSFRKESWTPKVEKIRKSGRSGRISKIKQKCQEGNIRRTEESNGRTL